MSKEIEKIYMNSEKSIISIISNKKKSRLHDYL